MTEPLANIAKSLESFWQNLAALISFIGLTMTTLLRPARWRETSLVANPQQISLNVVPIISMLTFMVGWVTAFLGSTVLSTFVASIRF
ncbi:TPA: hypothetical protein MYL73_003741 [Klebsiella pneumoniae]|nr:hypothetical protein [Klebsiella pneumoniae]